jgi:hypothetical protein
LRDGVFKTLTVMKRIQIIVLSISLLSFQFSSAQNDSTQQQKPKFKIGINYNSGLNYYGRTDSLKSSAVFPSAELWFTKDVYVSASPVFVNNAVQSLEYAGTVTSIGYLHTTDKWITNLYILKPFYKQSSELVQSALKAQTGLSFSRLNKMLNVTVGGDLKYSDKIDFGVTAGLDHLVRKQLKNNSVLVIDPSFYAYAGTQNFTNTYYKKKSGFLFFPGSSEQVNESETKFSVLAYEFSMPLVYARGKWMALVTPSYILPQNLVTIAGRPYLSERGQNMFYATAGVKHTF